MESKVAFILDWKSRKHQVTELCALSITDNHSRYLPACQGLPGTLLEPTQAVLSRVFKEHGPPSRMRSDNGVPFAAYTLGRLSRLSVWLLKLGVLPELIEPGKPQQNGRHERMHRTLKDETLKPPAANARAQQRKLNAWRRGSSTKTGRTKRTTG